MAGNDSYDDEEKGRSNGLEIVRARLGITDRLLASWERGSASRYKLDAAALLPFLHRATPFTLPLMQQPPDVTSPMVHRGSSPILSYVGLVIRSKNDLCGLA